MTTSTDVVRTEDVTPVRSRIGWGAVFAGFMVALAMYILLSLLGTAVGLSVVRSVRDDVLGYAAIAWSIVTILVSMFMGGWVMTQLEVGENRGEAVLHGIILWGVMFAALLWMASTGIRIGFNALLGVAANPAVQNLSAEDLQRHGYNTEEINRIQTWFQNMPAELRSLAQDARTVQAAWWTFFGLLLSLLASIGGALAGAGPALNLRTIYMRYTSITGLGGPAR